MSIPEINALIPSDSLGCHCHHLELALKHAVTETRAFKDRFDLLSELASALRKSSRTMQFIEEQYASLYSTDVFTVLMIVAER